MPPRRRSRPPSLLGLLLLAACAGTPARPRAIAAVKHAGFRSDIPAADRGNGVFDDIWWSIDGSLFMTAYHLSPVLSIRDGSTGALRGRVTATPIEGVALLDGRSQRMVGRAAGDSRLTIFDITNGSAVASIPDEPSGPNVPLGLTRDGSGLIVAAPSGIAIWGLTDGTRLRATSTPLSPTSYHPTCVGGIPATYNDKRCWELSPGGRWLAAAVTTSPNPVSTSFYLVDLGSMEMEELTLPVGGEGQSLASFAFSSDDARLAVGTYEGFWLYDLQARQWSTLIPGTHPRNRYLGPMRFSADGRQVVVLGDQAQTTLFDAASGRQLAQMTPETWDWEAIFRVSQDGSRIVLYHFVSDILEVLDGGTMQRIGWVCPYYCNMKHNPVPVAFAVSPDGRVVAASHRYGAALWRTDTDEIIAPLDDTTMPPLPAPQ